MREFGSDYILTKIGKIPIFNEVSARRYKYPYTTFFQTKFPQSFLHKHSNDEYSNHVFFSNEKNRFSALATYVTRRRARGSPDLDYPLELSL